MLTRQDYCKYYLPVLNLLAKRLSPHCLYWREWVSIENSDEMAKCNICGIIDKGNDPESVYAHGMQHLKEYNLLPFI